MKIKFEQVENYNLPENHVLVTHWIEIPIDGAHTDYQKKWNLQLNDIITSTTSLEKIREKLDGDDLSLIDECVNVEPYGSLWGKDDMGFEGVPIYTHPTPHKLDSPDNKHGAYKIMMCLEVFKGNYTPESLDRKCSSIVFFTHGKVVARSSDLIDISNFILRCNKNVNCYKSVICSNDEYISGGQKSILVGYNDNSIIESTDRESCLIGGRIQKGENFSLFMGINEDGIKQFGKISCVMVGRHNAMQHAEYNSIQIGGTDSYQKTESRATQVSDEFSIQHSFDECNQIVENNSLQIASNNTKQIGSSRCIQCCEKNCIQIIENGYQKADIGTIQIIDNKNTKNPNKYLIRVIDDDTKNKWYKATVNGWESLEDSVDKDGKNTYEQLDIVWELNEILVTAKHLIYDENDNEERVIDINMHNVFGL